MSDHQRPRVLRAACGSCHLLLLAYPRDFQERFGAEMSTTLQDHLAQCDRQGGTRAVLAAWSAAFLDLLRGVVAERALQMLGAGRPFARGQASWALRGALLGTVAGLLWTLAPLWEAYRQSPGVLCDGEFIAMTLYARLQDTALLGFLGACLGSVACACWQSSVQDGPATRRQGSRIGLASAPAWALAGTVCAVAQALVIHYCRRALGMEPGYSLGAAGVLATAVFWAAAGGLLTSLLAGGCGWVRRRSLRGQATSGQTDD
ncbi:MAG TPA: hypothetical protein VGN26_23655 [Armatimonadota bacterium]|jgi:hypothetical protein